MYARKSHTNNIFFGAVKIASHRNFLRITFNFASQNLDFASQTAMRYRISSSLDILAEGGDNDGCDVGHEAAGEFERQR